MGEEEEVLTSFSFIAVFHCIYSIIFKTRIYTDLRNTFSFSKKESFTKEICFSFSTGFLFLKKKKCCV
ncbi:MAG: hypothetical protein U9N01_02960, partial [Euryarchaeota archaeon]|nr:hypothetical protein [Euryarchaeota archaeon]